VFEAEEARRQEAERHAERLLSVVHDMHESEPISPPWVLSVADKTRISGTLKTWRFPDSMSTSVRSLIELPSTLKAADWIGLLGPLGVALLELTSLPLEYKRLFQRFMLWCWRLRAKEISHDRLRKCSIEGPIIFTQMESALPMYAATINQHVLSHLPDRILVTGPIQCSHMMGAERENGLLKRLITSRNRIPATLSTRLELMVAMDRTRAQHPEMFVCRASRSRPGGLQPIGEPAAFEVATTGTRNLHVDQKQLVLQKLNATDVELLHHYFMGQVPEYRALVHESQSRTARKTPNHSLERFLAWRPAEGRVLNPVEQRLARGVSRDAFVTHRAEVNEVHFRSRPLETAKHFVTANCGISVEYLDGDTGQRRIGYGRLEAIFSYTPFPPPKGYEAPAHLRDCLFVKGDWYETVGMQTNGLVLVQQAKKSSRSFLRRYPIGPLVNVRPVHISFADALVHSKSFWVIEH